MANYLRSMLQVVNLAGDVLEQAVNLVTNDNLDLGCAVIEKSATEKVETHLVTFLFPILELIGTIWLSITSHFTTVLQDLFMFSKNMLCLINRRPQ